MFSGQVDFLANLIRVLKNKNFITEKFIWHNEEMLLPTTEKSEAKHWTIVYI